MNARAICRGVVVVAVLAACSSVAHSQQVSGKRVALLVGVNKYLKPGLPDLSFAEADARAISEQLNADGFRTTLLLGSEAGDKQARRDNILAAARRMVQNLGKDDLALVMLSGHGQQFRVRGKDGDSRDDGFFIPVEGVKNDPATLVSLSLLIDEILAPNVGQKLVLVDACRNTPKDPSRGAKGIQGRVIALPEDTAVLFSCRAGQESYENEELKHGLFTHCLLEGLRGKAAAEEGDVAWDDLVAYVTRRMASKEIRGRMPEDRRQEPIPAGGVGRVVLRLDVRPAPKVAVSIPKADVPLPKTEVPAPKTVTPVLKTNRPDPFKTEFTYDGPVVEVGLGIKGAEIRQLQFSDHTVRPNTLVSGPGFDLVDRGSLNFVRDAARGGWALTSIVRNGKAEFLESDEAFSPARIAGLIARLETLKAGTTSTPQEVKNALQMGAFINTKEFAASLRSHGIYLGGEQVASANGALFVGMSDGVQYALRFGSLYDPFALDDQIVHQPDLANPNVDNPPDRYLLITVNVDGDLISKSGDHAGKVRRAEERAGELNKKFSNSYYVISKDDFQELRLTRADVIVKKSK